MMDPIPVLSVDLSNPAGWADALASTAASGRDLVTAFNAEGEREAGHVGWAALRTGADVINRLLGRHYGAEIDAIARTLDVDAADILLANLAYDVSHMGCSTMAVPRVDGPLHARNLDWTFPGGLLARHLVVVRAEGGGHGPYKMITWPGFFGSLTGVAPGRFSITVNYVCHDEESTWRGVCLRAARGLWPVSWVMRRAFDEARDFSAAVRLLSDEPLLAPVLFMVVGTTNTERVVIERACESVVRRTTALERPLCLTNHYLTAKLGRHNSELGEMDSLDRLEALQYAAYRTAMRAPDAALDVLRGEGILRDDTQYQVVLEPRSGDLTVQTLDGRTCTA